VRTGAVASRAIRMHADGRIRTGSPRVRLQLSVAKPAAWINNLATGIDRSVPSMLYLITLRCLTHKKERSVLSNNC
jgi:hypothetical protein